MTDRGLTPRQTEILGLARGQGRVTVDGLAAQFTMTPQTIRKDLNALCDRRYLQRIHGGAVVTAGVENLGYDARQMMAREEKRRIGRSAAQLIPNNCSLFINIGTTTEAVAHALAGHTELMVITNNINVANILRFSAGIEVIIAGGVVRHSDGGVVGESAVDFINQFKVDYAVIGASAIDEDGTLLDFDYREVRVARAIIANARNVLLVADSMKLARSAPVRIGHISQIATFVTDVIGTDSLRQACAQAGVRVVCTGE